MFKVYITPRFYILFKQIKPGFNTHQPISVTFKTPPKLQSLNKCLRLIEFWNSRTDPVVNYVQEVIPPRSYLLSLD